MSTRTWMIGVLTLGCAVGVQAAEAGESRRLVAEDFAALKEIGKPRISPEGEWVVFELETRDLKKDESETRL